MLRHTDFDMKAETGHSLRFAYRSAVRTKLPLTVYRSMAAYAIFDQCPMSHLSA